MVSVIAFLCAVSIAPAYCGRDNAVDVLTFPAAPNELVCMRDSQITLASLAITADRLHYWQVRCVRTIGKGTVG